MFKGISIKAVGVGMLVDIGLTQWWGLQYVFWLAVSMLLESAGRLDTVAYRQALESTSFQVLGLSYGSISSLIGGALTARLAAAEPMKNVYALCGVELIFTVAYLTFSKEHSPIWYMVMGALLSIGMPVVGGHLSRWLFGPGPSPVDGAADSPRLASWVTTVFGG